MKQLTGSNSAGKVSYGTEGGFYQEAGIPTIVCGPGDIAQAHKPDEFVTEAQLDACDGFIRRLVDRLADLACMVVGPPPLPSFAVRLAAAGPRALAGGQYRRPGLHHAAPPATGAACRTAGADARQRTRRGDRARPAAARRASRPARGRLTFGFVNLAAFDRFDPRQPTLSRFVDEDLNRVWDTAVLDGPRRSVELDRAREIRPLIDTVDVLLDLHSMLWPSEPLILCGMSPQGPRAGARRSARRSWSSPITAMPAAGG